MEIDEREQVVKQANTNINDFFMICLKTFITCSRYQVDIYVDIVGVTGRVVSMVTTVKSLPGVPATTDTAPCLLSSTHI